VNVGAEKKMGRAFKPKGGVGRGGVIELKKTMKEKKKGRGERPYTSPHLFGDYRMTTVSATLKGGGARGEKKTRKHFD